MRALANIEHCYNCGVLIPCSINRRRAKRRGYGYCSHSCAAPKPRNARDRFIDNITYEPNTGCWLWLGSVHTRTGYGQFGSGGASGVRGKTLKAHRVSFELFKHKIPLGMLVCHTCDNRICVNPEHLFVGTNNDNLEDMRKKDRHSRGERCRTSKLKDWQVLEIRSSKDRHATIARKYGVSQTTIFHIIRRNTWKHLKQSEANRETAA